MKRGDRILPTKEDIFQISENGKLIFEKELGAIPNKTINSPLREDKSPSFSIYLHNDGIWKFKDFSNGDGGNCIDFIMKRYNLTFKEALEYVQKGINTAEISNNIPKMVLNIKKEKLNWEYELKDWGENHIKYWDKYKLPIDFLEENGVFPLAAYAINKKVTRIPVENTAFIYLHPSGGFKILHIGDNVEKKWINNLNNDTLWFTPEYACKKLWCVKSVKDALCLKYHFNMCVCANQNESAAILDKNMPKLLKLVEKNKDLVICWGADNHAVEQCKIVQQKYKTSYFNTPKYLYTKYQLEDISDVIAEFGVEIVRKELIKKKFL